MPSFNRVILAGHLTRDPELRQLPGGSSVCGFGIATNRKWRDKDGNQKDEVCFVDLQAFGKTGELIHQYHRKGSAILVEGRLTYRQWEAKDGTKRNKLDVTVENFTFLSSGGGDTPPPPPSTNGPAPEPPQDDIPF